MKKIFFIILCSLTYSTAYAENCDRIFNKMVDKVNEYYFVAKGTNPQVPYMREDYKTSDDVKIYSQKSNANLQFDFISEQNQFSLFRNGLNIGKFNDFPRVKLFQQSNGQWTGTFDSGQTATQLDCTIIEETNNSLQFFIQAYWQYNYSNDNYSEVQLFFIRSVDINDPAPID